ncbi:MAG: hypothetical protein ACFFBD_08620 [Candidatus Hodarchaeota archaeon]
MKKRVFIFSTSREPTRRIRSFIREMVRGIPFSSYISRGHKSLLELAIDAKNSQAERLVICSAYKGNPGKLTFYSLSDKFEKYPIEFQILGVTLYREKHPNTKMKQDLTKLDLSFGKNIPFPLHTFLEDFLDPVLIAKGEERTKKTGNVCLTMIGETKIEMKIKLQETEKLNSPIIRFTTLYRT